MAVRRTWSFNTNQTNLGDGLILSQLADLKGRKTDYVSIPFALDLGGSNRLQLGDTVAGGRSGISLQTQVMGGWGYGDPKVLTSADSPYTVTDDDAVILCNTGGGNITVNLPAGSNYPGRKLYFKKTAEANLLTLDGNGAELIDNETTLVIGTDGGDFDRAVQIVSNGSGWEIVTNVTRMRNLLSNFAPAATTTSGSNATIATSASFVFSGRDVLFFLHGNMRNNNGANEYMQVAFALRFDTGTSTDICEWNSNLADNHQAFSGSLILNPTAGSHTVDLRWRRISGAGTATFDGNDFYVLNMIEL